MTPEHPIRMKKRLRVLLLVHYSLIPPEDLTIDDPRIETFRTEYDVKTTLNELGHEVMIIGAHDDLTPIRSALEEWQPDIIFNLLEEFAGNPAFDYYIVSYLEMMGIPYTGCNPRGLMLARDKALSNILLSHHRIHVPEFKHFPRGRAIRPVKDSLYPLIVKSQTHEGSIGIAQASYVTNIEQLRERVALIHEKTHDDAIAERYIEGRELYVTVIGNTRLTVLPFRELFFGDTEPGMPRLATYKVKWDENYRERWQMTYDFAIDLSPELQDSIARICKRACRILDLNGYIRFDIRLDANNKPYILEANPNPGISSIEDSSYSAEQAGLNYPAFIQHLINLGLRANRTG
jgi:D-alanine-D-alanine ligase